MERTNSQYNLHIYDSFRTTLKNGIPVIEKQDIKLPESLIGFNEAITARNTDCGIHFFLDDYQFERVWNQPERYVAVLKKFKCVFSPDFSLYMDMPKAMQLWNIYRSRLLGQYWQDNGINVIPTISWSDEKSFDFCFDGIPSGCTVAISTVGVMKSNVYKKPFIAGVKAMMERIMPTTVIVYGKAFPEAFDGIKFIQYENMTTKRLNSLKTIKKD